MPFLAVLAVACHALGTVGAEARQPVAPQLSITARCDLSGHSVQVSSRRHLSPDETAAALKRGRQTEQLLGLEESADGRRAVRWLTASTNGRMYELRLHVVEDVGTDELLDVSEFPPLDPEEYVGEGRLVAVADDPTSVLQAAAQFGAADGRWVNQGLVEAEYADVRRGT